MGLCLRSSVYCNGTKECPDGSDEPPNCRSEFVFLVSEIFNLPVTAVDVLANTYGTKMLTQVDKKFIFEL